MLRLNENDPLDRMLLQELKGEPVLFDTWLETMDELAEEPDCAQIFQERGLCTEDVLWEAEACREDFYARLSKWKIPKDRRFDLCTVLFLQAKKEPSPELLRIYCEILCGHEFLLDAKPELEDSEEEADYEEQVILQYLDFCQERDELLQTMIQHKELPIKLAEATKQIRNPKPADCDTKRSYEIAKCFVELFDLPAKGNSDILLNNLSNYIQTAASSHTLKSIEPLFLFRLLTRHKSRMCTVPDLNVNLSALWKRDRQNIDHNNGRNFKQCRLNLHLFYRLCQIYQEEREVDFPLCWYGLDQLTLLGAFYWKHIACDWAYADSEDDFPFIPTVEDLVEDAWFSCFENGHGDNPFLRDGDVIGNEFSLCVIALEKTRKTA